MLVISLPSWHLYIHLRWLLYIGALGNKISHHALPGIFNWGLLGTEISLILAPLDRAIQITLIIPLIPLEIISIMSLSFSPHLVAMF